MAHHILVTNQPNQKRLHTSPRSTPAINASRPYPLIALATGTNRRCLDDGTG